MVAKNLKQENKLYIRAPSQVHVESRELAFPSRLEFAHASGSGISRACFA